MGNEQSGPAGKVKATVHMRKYGLAAQPVLGKNHDKFESSVLGKLHKVQQQRKATQERHAMKQEQMKNRAATEELKDNLNSLFEEYVKRPWGEAVQKPLGEFMDDLSVSMGCVPRGDGKGLARTSSNRSTSSDSSNASEWSRRYENHRVLAEDFEELLRMEEEKGRSLDQEERRRSTGAAA